MIKHLLLITLIITIGFSQPSDDVLFGPDPLLDDGQVDVVPVEPTDEMVFDNSLPLSDNFDADGEVSDVQTVTPAPAREHQIWRPDGELTAEEHVEQKLTKVWVDNLFTFQNFADLFAFGVNYIQTEIDELQVLRGEQAERCAGFQTDIEAVERDMERTEGFINWLTTRIAANEAQIEEIFDGRCKNHMNYLNFMKNSQITLRLLAFLRSALENYSFVQMKHVGEILSKYSKSKLSNEEVMRVMLVELKDIQDRVAVRTAEETGTKHIDDGRDDLSLDSMEYRQRQDLGEYKVQLLAIITQLEADVNGEMERRQNDEVELNQKVIEWTQNLNNEIHELQTHLVEESANLQSQNNDLQTFIYESETCNAELQWIEDNITALKNYLEYVQTHSGEFEALYQEERDKYVLSSTLVPN